MITIDTRRKENKKISEEDRKNTIDEDLELVEVIDRIQNQDTCADDLKDKYDDIIRIGKYDDYI